MKNNKDVLIVGAGPVGLFMAFLLQKQGISFDLIDKKAELSPLSKALGLHLRSLMMFADLELYEDFAKHGLKVEHIHFNSKKKRLASVDFAMLNAPFKHLLDCPQNQTEAIFYQALIQQNREVLFNHELISIHEEQEGITAEINHLGEDIKKSYQYIIATDGAHSTLRDLLNMSFKGAAYSELFWLADLHIDWAYSDSDMQLFATKEGISAFFPMGDKRYRLIFSSPPHTEQTDRQTHGLVMGERKKPTFEMIQKVFNERLDVRACLYNPYWISAFKIAHRQIDHYNKGRVFFAGDSAHIHSPMGGQGLNTGLQDVYNLAWKLKWVLSKKASIDLLDTYHQERHPVGKEVLALTDKMTKAMTIKNPVLIHLRNTLMHHLLKSKRLRQKIAYQLSELAVQYEHSPLTLQLAKLSRFKAGDLMPHFDFHAHGKQITLMQALAGHYQFHVLVFLVDEHGVNLKDREALKSLSEKLDANVTIFSSKAGLDDDYHSYAIDRAQFEALEIQKNMLMVLRPDKYILTQMPLTQLDTKAIEKVMSLTS